MTNKYVCLDGSKINWNYNIDGMRIAVVLKVSA